MSRAAWAGRAAALLAVLLLAALAGAAPAQASPEVERAYRQAADTYHGLRERNDAAPAAWHRVAEAFMEVHRQAPEHRRGADALFSAGLAWREGWRRHEDGDALGNAMRVFQRFSGRYPDNSLADDSLVHLAGLLEQGRGDAAAAATALERVMQRYPDGDQAPAVKGRLAVLEARLAGERGSLAEPATYRPGQASQREARTPQRQDGTARVRRVQHWSGPEWTRVVITTDAGVGHEQHRLPAGGGSPPRLFFDFRGAVPAEPLAAVSSVDDAVLQRIRVSRHSAEVTRVVLDLAETDRFEVKTFTLPRERKVVVDLYPPDGDEGSDSAASRPRTAQAPDSGSEATSATVRGPGGSESAPVSLRRSLGLKVRSVMLDPGHGGKDPGAVAYGAKEKDLVLRIARRVRTMLSERHPNLRVGLTREDDRFIPLQERPRIAKEFGADLFVSIHLNANPFRRFHGVETYFLNLTSDQQALQVAARENATTRQRVSDLNNILMDLLRDSNIVESGRLARSVQGALVDTLRDTHGSVRDLGVKQAPFLVLMGAEMPSVLVEGGFLTNPEENRRLKQEDYLHRIAEGIYAGLQGYIEDSTIVQQDAAPPDARS